MNKYQKAVRKHKRYARKLKYKPKMKIERPIVHPNMIIRRFSRINFADYSLQYLWTNQGSAQLDYALNMIFDVDELAYYKQKYIFANMLNFTITFYVSDLRNMVQRWDTGGTQVQVATTQVTDTSQALLAYIGHFNSPEEQSNYVVSFGSDVNIAHQRLHSYTKHPAMRRLTQRNTVQYNWQMPIGYRSTYSNMSVPSPNGWTLGTSLEDALSGPLGDEPHGFVFWLPTYGQYANESAQEVHIGYKIDATFCFKGLKHGALDS
jgi:hypothetical protein